MVTVNLFEILSFHYGHPLCFICEYRYISKFFNPGSVVDPDPLVTGTEDPDPDPSVIKQKCRKTLIPTVL